MIHLEIDGERYPIAAGETVIGSAVRQHGGSRWRGRAAPACRGAGDAGRRRRDPRCRGPRPRCGSTGSASVPIPRRCSMATRSDRQSRAAGGGSGSGGQHPAVRLRRLRRPRAAAGLQGDRDQHRWPAGLSHRRTGVQRGRAAALAGTGCRIGCRGVRERGFAPACRDPQRAGRIHSDRSQRQRHLRERRAHREDPSAGAGRRDPDRQR